MVWKEITIGFLLAVFIAQLGNGVFASLFVRDAPQPIPALENVVVGPVIAVLSFVCSVGNVPLAAVLWSGGISFAVPRATDSRASTSPHSPGAA